MSSISATGRLEELNGVARRVVDQNLRAAGSAHNRVAEPQAGRAEPGYLAGDVVHDELKPIPSAWNGRRPSGSGRPAELVGPLSNNRRSPSTTSAKAGAALDRSLKPKCIV